MGCSLPGSSVHRILQAGILKWVAISFSIGISFDIQIWWSKAVHSTWLRRCAQVLILGPQMFWSFISVGTDGLEETPHCHLHVHRTVGGGSQRCLVPRVIMLRSQEMKLMSLTCSNSSLDYQTLGYVVGSLSLNGNVWGKIRESLMILSWIEGLLISHELNYYIHCTSACFRTQSSYRINPMRFWLP